MNSKFYYHRFRYKVRRIIQPSVRIQLGQKPIIIPTDNIDETFAISQWQPSWKTEIIKQLTPLKTGDFLDIGANIGQTLFDFLGAQHQGKYIGFEPNWRCVSLLRKIIDHNQLDNCTIIPIGLSDCSKILTFYFHSGTPIDQAATTISTLRPGRIFETEFIPCYRFDEVRETLGLQALSLVKIDVEGAELPVIEGMRHSLVELKPFIICEVLYADSKADLDAYSKSVKELMALLIDINYFVFRLVKVNDTNNLEKMVKISTFPVKYWTKENANECDYLFVPEEEISKIASSGIPCEME